MGSGEIVRSADPGPPFSTRVGKTGDPVASSPMGGGLVHVDDLDLVEWREIGCISSDQNAKLVGEHRGDDVCVMEPLSVQPVVQAQLTLAQV